VPVTAQWATKKLFIVTDLTRFFEGHQQDQEKKKKNFSGPAFFFFFLEAASSPKLGNLDRVQYS